MCMLAYCIWKDYMCYIFYLVACQKQFILLSIVTPTLKVVEVYGCGR
jgi:hypothetical protein